MEMTEEQRRELEERLRSMSPEELREYQKKQCIFCRMVSGEIPSKKVYEDDKVFAILDINPATAGHLLLLPKEHYMLLQQMPDDDVGHLFLIARSFSQAFLQALRAEGTTFFCASGQAAGQRAQHVMIHLIPRKEDDHIGIKPKPLPVRPQDLEVIAKAIKPFTDKALGFSGKVEAGKPEAGKPEAGILSEKPKTSESRISDQQIPDPKKSSSDSVRDEIREEIQENFQADSEETDTDEEEEEEEQPRDAAQLTARTPNGGKGSSSLDDIADFLSKK